MKDRAEGNEPLSKAGTWKSFVRIYLGKTVRFLPLPMLGSRHVFPGQNIRDLGSLIWI